MPKKRAQMPDPKEVPKFGSYTLFRALATGSSSEGRVRAVTSAVPDAADLYTPVEYIQYLTFPHNGKFFTVLGLTRPNHPCESAL